MGPTMSSYRVLLAVALVLPGAASLGLGQTTSGTPGIGASGRDRARGPAVGPPRLPRRRRRRERRRAGHVARRRGDRQLQRELPHRHPDGRLVDLGGQFPVFTDDEGRNWSEVLGVQNNFQSTVTIRAAEGATVVAPNGDILGISWTSVSDRLQSFKYDADRGEWFHQEAPVHTPLYDRPWLSLIPGPVTVQGQTVPYVAVAQGGTGSKEVFTLSLDGLNYVVPSSKQVDGLLQGTEVSTLDPPGEPSADWTQPHTEGHVVPLPSGSALACRQTPLVLSCSGDWFRMGEDLRWDPFDVPSGLGDGRCQVPSDGALHRVQTDDGATNLTYAVSTDGGQSFAGTNLSLPANHTVEDWDFKVNADLGFAAVAVHAHNETGDVDQDLVYKVDVTQTPPSLDVLYFVGDGDVEAGSGLGADNRFDFSTVAILPSGRIATSTIDQAHEDPSVAIQA